MGILRWPCIGRRSSWHCKLGTEPWCGRWVSGSSHTPAYLAGFPGPVPSNRSTHVCLDDSSSSSTCPNNNQSLRWSTASDIDRCPLAVHHRLVWSLLATWSILAALWSICRLSEPTSLSSRRSRLLCLASLQRRLGPAVCPATSAVPNLVRASKTRTLARAFFHRISRKTCSTGPNHKRGIDHSHSCRVGGLAFLPSVQL